MDYDACAWFPLRITYCRELKLQSYFDALGMETFIPMHYEYVTSKRKRERKLVPMIHNLLFVKTTRRKISEVKLDATLPIRYIMHRNDSGMNEPLVVREDAMKNFMRVARAVDEDIRLVSNGEQLSKGDYVRITDGIFAGTVGILTRIAGARARRVVVTLQGVISITTAEVPCQFIEKL